MLDPGVKQTVLARHCLVVGLVMLGACRPAPAPPTPLEQETAERRALIDAVARDPALNEGGETAGRAKVSRDQRPH